MIPDWLGFLQGRRKGPYHGAKPVAERLNIWEGEGEGECERHNSSIFVGWFFVSLESPLFALSAEILWGPHDNGGKGQRQKRQEN